jgi:hypothetical protein
MHGEPVQGLNPERSPFGRLHEAGNYNVALCIHFFSKVAPFCYTFQIKSALQNLQIRIMCRKQFMLRALNNKITAQLMTARQKDGPRPGPAVGVLSVALFV